MSDEAKVIDFKSHTAPSARVKSWQDVGDKRSACPHIHVEVYDKEPILECRDCGGIVDPYWWIRRRCADWKQMTDAVEYKVKDTKRELEELRVAVRHLRGEWKDAAEKNAAERHSLMIVKPRRSF